MVVYAIIMQFKDYVEDYIRTYLHIRRSNAQAANPETRKETRQSTT